MLENGVAVLNGRVDRLDVPAHQRREISLPLGDMLSRKGEILLNLKYRLKQAQPLLPAGHTLAYQQLSLRDYEPAALELCSKEAPAIRDNDTRLFIVEGENFVVEFNRRSGLITRYEANGRQLLLDGASLRPNFWRAPTDNDFGAGLQRRYEAWKNPEMKVESFEGRMDGKLAVVNVTFGIESLSAKLLYEYRIDAQGAIRISQKLVTTPGAKVSEFFRFGMRMEMPESFEYLQYYGRGPMENYADRNNCSLLGIYKQTVTEQFYPYIRPQETGTKTDLRWWRVLDRSGRGIEVISEAPFSASALHYSIETLDDGPKKLQRHSHELDQEPLTSLCIDKVQMGLACEDSWGAIPRPEYRLPYQDYEFVFIIKPISLY